MFAISLGIVLYDCLDADSTNPSSTLLQQPLRFYDNAPYYQAQRTRIHFKMSHILRHQGLVLAAEGGLQMACTLRNALVPSYEVKGPWALLDEDFDDLVVVWDR